MSAKFLYATDPNKPPIVLERGRSANNKLRYPQALERARHGLSHRKMTRVKCVCGKSSRMMSASAAVSARLRCSSCPGGAL